MPLLNQRLASIARAVEGRAEAQVALPGGGALTVADLGAGDLFGAMVLIERGVSTATMSAP